MIVADAVVAVWIAAFRADATIVALLDGDDTRILGPYSSIDKDLPVLTIEHTTIDLLESSTLASDTLEIAAWGDDPDVLDRLRGRACEIVKALRYDIARLHVVQTSVSGEEYLVDVDSYVQWQQFRVLSAHEG